MDWKHWYQEARRLLREHGRPEAIERFLQLAVDAYPAVFLMPCPHCEVQVGYCVTPLGRPTETHSARLRMVTA